MPSEARARKAGRRRPPFAEVRAALLLVGAALGALGAAPAQGAVVDRTLAFVGRQPVLLSDVRLEMALQNVPEPRALENVIDQVLMFEEASRIAAATPDREDFATAVADLRRKAGPAWSDAALKRAAARELAILSYVRQRIAPLVRVDDADVRQAWEERTRGEASPVPYEEAAPGLRVALENAALGLRMEEWIRTLKERAEIRRIP